MGIKNTLTWSTKIPFAVKNPAPFLIANQQVALCFHFA
jgi:hypothetical protein